MRVIIRQARNGWIAEPDYPREPVNRSRIEPEDCHVFESWLTLVTWLHNEIGHPEQPVKT